MITELRENIYEFLIPILDDVAIKHFGIKEGWSIPMAHPDYYTNERFGILEFQAGNETRDITVQFFEQRRAKNQGMCYIVFDGDTAEILYSCDRSTQNEYGNHFGLMEGFWQSF